jgi:hypothetical protein
MSTSQSIVLYVLHISGLAGHALTPCDIGAKIAGLDLKAGLLQLPGASPHLRAKLGKILSIEKHGNPEEAGYSNCEGYEGEILDTTSSKITGIWISRKAMGTVSAYPIKGCANGAW